VLFVDLEARLLELLDHRRGQLRPGIVRRALRDMIREAHARHGMLG
jgi:hypothetical protein